jgi:hypothetical protein
MPAIELLHAYTILTQFGGPLPLILTLQSPMFISPPNNDLTFCVKFSSLSFRFSSVFKSCGFKMCAYFHENCRLLSLIIKQLHVIWMAGETIWIQSKMSLGLCRMPKQTDYKRPKDRELYWHPLTSLDYSHILDTCSSLLQSS